MTGRASSHRRVGLRLLQCDRRAILRTEVNPMYEARAPISMSIFFREIGRLSAGNERRKKDGQHRQTHTVRSAHTHKSSSTLRADRDTRLSEKGQGWSASRGMSNDGIA